MIGVGVSGGVPRAAIAGRRTIVLEDLSTRHAVSLELRPRRGTRVLFSAEGNRVVTFAAGTRARIWDAASGRLLAQAAGRGYSRDQFGRPVCRDDRRLPERRPSGARARAPVADLGPAGGVVFSPDAALVPAVGDDGGAGVWRTATGSQIAAFPGFGSLGQRARNVVHRVLARRGLQPRRTPARACERRRHRPDLGRRRTEAGRGVAAGWANALAFAPRGGMLAAMAWNGEVVLARSPTSVPLRTGFRPRQLHSRLRSAPEPRREARARRVPPRGQVSGPSPVHRIATLTPPGRPAAMARNVGWAAFSGDGTTVAAASSSERVYPDPPTRHTALRSGGWAGAVPCARCVPTGRSCSTRTGGWSLSEDGVWRTSGGEPSAGWGRCCAQPRAATALAIRGGSFEVVETAHARRWRCFTTPSRLCEQRVTSSPRGVVQPGRAAPADELGLERPPVGRHDRRADRHPRTPRRGVRQVRLRRRRTASCSRRSPTERRCSLQPTGRSCHPSPARSMAAPSPRTARLRPRRGRWRHQRHRPRHGHPCPPPDGHRPPADQRLLRADRRRIVARDAGATSMSCGARSAPRTMSC